MNRLVIVPEPSLEAAGLQVATKLAAIVSDISAAQLSESLGRHALRCLAWAVAEDPSAELILWGNDGADHALAWTSADGVTRAQADGNDGLIAHVAASQRSAAEGAYELQAGEWTNLERMRGVSISAMAASPVVAFGTTVAVLSRVLYGTEESGPPAPPADTASLLGRLVEDRLIRATLGMDSP